MPGKNNSPYLEVAILVATGFDEEETARCLRTMRQAGLATEVIGHKAGLITGASGLTIRPDRTLVDLNETAGLRLVILPGQVHSAMSLLIDPRVHRLFATVAAGGGRVAVMSQAEEAFARAGLVELLADPSVVRQGQEDLATFSQYLMDSFQI